ncbi:hypothetical protein EA187_05850 [Lujinxingia sediminis]|uniref:Tetratricopeptide repeat protein n=1 Tax=Lujinxingia sediminis TaxID=2480984 RepID=A0ABY0CZ86_9DELT|nr:hypothetical protein [Lujinxingia sediminis]RVU48949.1 hypothetical protein EA187_05850 [Lujinxingia sediminis]
MLASPGPPPLFAIFCIGPTIMMNRDLSELLEGLPDTAPGLVKAARAYDEAGDYRNAEALLRGALARCSTPELRLASAEHLLARGRWAAAYQQARHAMANPMLWEAAVAAARASHKLGEHGRAQSLLDDALDRGADLTLISAWRDHFAGLADAPAPRRPATLAPAERALPDFTEEPTELVDGLAPHEPTHLVHIPASLSDAPRAKSPGRAPAPGFEPDETTLRRRQPRAIRPGTSAPELADALANVPSEPTDVFAAAPTLPPGADLAQELPRHDSGRRNAPALRVAPRAANHSAPGVAAKRGEPRHPGREEKLELDLDALRRTGKPTTGGTSSIRRLTHLVQTSLPEPLQSPARAMISVLLSSLLVLSFFATLGYIGQVHRATATLLRRAESEVHNDTYASHQRALQLAQEARAYTLLPAGADAVVRGLTDALPAIGTRAPVERATNLEELIRARTAYRFTHPGTIAPPEPPTSRAGETIAAHIYASAAWLPGRDISRAADALLALAPSSAWARLAYAEVLVDHIPVELSAKLVDSFPEDTPARAFVRAQHLLSFDEEAATPALRAIFEANPDHYSSRLTLALHLARTGADEAELDALLSSALSAPGREFAPADRALIHLARAEASSTTNERIDALRLAAEAAPLRPDRIRPLIDELIARGQLLDAREQLIRTPRVEHRHTYFDLELASIHLQLGDTDRAIALLSAASDNPHERLLLALAMAAEGNLAIARDELAQTPLDLAAAALLDALHPEATPPEETFDRIADFASERALLKSATLAHLANHSESWEAQSTLRERSLSRLEHAPDRLARRLLQCRLALDARHASDAAEHCARLEELDVASRWALDAAVRWHRLNDRHATALRLIDRHEDLSGPGPLLGLMRAEVAFEQGDVDAATSFLEPALGTPLSRSARWATLQGRLALSRGDSEQAQAHLQSALDTRPGDAAATLGLLQTALANGPLSSENEQALRGLLRHGKLGPEAWVAFARQRRQQQRYNDALENLELARRAANTLVPAALSHAILTEEAYVRAARSRRGFADPGVTRALDLAGESAPQSADYLVARARVALASRRPNRAEAARHLEDALNDAPLRCELWEEVIALRKRLRHQVAVRRLVNATPERCN